MNLLEHEYKYHLCWSKWTVEIRTTSPPETLLDLAVWSPSFISISLKVPERTEYSKVQLSTIIHCRQDHLKWEEIRDIFDEKYMENRTEGGIRKAYSRFRRKEIPPKNYLRTLR